MGRVLKRGFNFGRKEAPQNNRKLCAQKIRRVSQVIRQSNTKIRQENLLIRYSIQKIRQKCIFFDD